MEEKIRLEFSQNGMHRKKSCRHGPEPSPSAQAPYQLDLP